MTMTFTQQEQERRKIELMLPGHYNVELQERPGSYRCTSSEGFRKRSHDLQDEERWERFVNAIRDEFGDRFLEIYHATNYCHVDFTVHLQPL